MRGILAVELFLVDDKFIITSRIYVYMGHANIVPHLLMLRLSFLNPYYFLLSMESDYEFLSLLLAQQIPFYLS